MRRWSGPRSTIRPPSRGARRPGFSWPAKLEPAERQELVSSVDLVPTILAAAAARSPNDLRGLNLLPHLKDGKAIERHVLFGESFAHDIADISNPEASLLYRWCIEGQWKLLLTYDGEVNRYASTHPRGDKRPQLYDLLKDPHEKTNVAKDHPDVVARLAERIAEWYPLSERKTKTRFE